MGLKKNSPLIAVRIGVLCFYTFFENFKFLACQGYQMELHSKGSQFSIFLGFLAVIFALLVLGYLMELHSKVFFFQNRTDFLKFFNFIACAKTLLNRPHLGWCSAVNLWRNSTRFVGFLAVIFTSQWLLASRNHWGLRKAKNSLQKFINLEKNSGEF